MFDRRKQSVSGSGRATERASAPFSLRVPRALQISLCFALFFLVCVAGLRGQTVLVGIQTLQTNLDTNAKGLAEAFPVTAVASGQVGSINFFLDESSTATKIYVGIYSNSNGNPGALLTQGNTTQLYPGTWNTATVSAVSLTSGTSYWIAILGTTSGQPYFYDQSTTACNSQTSSQTTLTSLPSTWIKGKTWNTCYISAYAVTGTLPATAMIGNQYVESYLDKNPAGRAEAFPNIANTTGSVGAIDLYLDPTSGSGPVYVGLYADSGSNHPGALLGQGSTSSPVAGSWNTISIAHSSITAGSRYWIAVLGTQATSPYFRDRQTSVCHSETTPQSNLTSLPSTWSTGTTWNTCYISAYGLAASGGSPVLSISPATLSFAAIQGGANPAAANLSVTNTGTGTLSFTDSTDQTWLSATPSSGTAPKTLQISATVGSLTAGTYTGHVTVTASGAQNSPATSTVTFTVSPFVPPSISAAASPSPNSNGWNNSTVTVTFTCMAGSYPIATCPSPIPVTTQAASQSICGQAVDTMGNSSAKACSTVSLDETPPTITAAVSPAPVGGINYGSATVTFTCSDALSGVASCPSPVTDTTIGSNQKISGTSTDKAGNSSTTSVTLNIQPLVPPSISAAASPAPNSNGWNNSTVTVTFTCTAGSYPVATCPSPVQVTAQGANQQICGKAVDTQGNSSTQACATVNLDETPPAITATVSPAPVGGINYGSATVTFTCSDGLSGVASCPPAVTDTTIGSTAFSGTATDKAGNSATASVTVNLQPSVLPTITAMASPGPNPNGWNNSTVTVTFTCTAGSYPIASCPSPVQVATQGANQQVCGKAVDTQGNSSAQACASVSIDETPPTITAAVTPAPIGGINYGSATVTFTCTDALSGVATCPSPVTVTTIGSTPVSGTATDKAGNSASTSVTVNVQPVVLPTISAAASPGPNGNGWNNSTVTVTFTCTPGSYPIATCPSPVQVTTQGANQQICGKAVDTQGNSSAQACASVSIDETPPTITAAVTPAPIGGINYGSATVTFTCTDALSGVATCPSPVTVTTIGSNQKISGTATDKAGNAASTSVTLNIQPVVLPTITATPSPAPNSSGWNNANVTVSFVCTAGSYPIQSCPSPVLVTTEGTNQSICGHAVDTQGNSSATACATVNLDKTPPTITATVSPAPIGGINYGTATVTFACSDGLSGVASCPSPVTITTIGSTPVNGTATDKAGNSASTSVTLNIQPVVLPTTSAAASPSPNSNGWNNSTVTVTFTCTAGSYPIATCPSPVQVTTPGASQSICGHAVDTQGNSSSQACATVSLDETAPTITAVVTPTPVGGINYGSATVMFTCTDALSGVATCPSPVTDTTVGSNAVSGTATDKAGNSASASVTLNIQPVVLPSISTTTLPTPNSNGWNTSSVTVNFTCTAGTYPIQSCPSPIPVTTEGAKQSICGHAVDTMGNSSAQVCDTVNLELTPPAISASASPYANSAGWNNSPVTVSFNCTPSVSSITSCSPNQTVSSQGMGQIITGTVQDQAGNQATTSVTLNIDLTPPTIVQFTAPSQLSPGQSGTATVTVTDIAPISSVVFLFSGSPVGTALTPPYTVNVTVPSNTTSGSTLTLTATVTDVAGNQYSANTGIQVVSSGVVVGQVLSDSTGLALQGATVQVLGQANQTATSDSNGKYSIPVTGGQLFVDVSVAATGSTPAMVTVERQISVQSGVGNVPVDARMTAQGAPANITASGGTVGSGAITITVPPGGTTTSYTLTPFSPQALPGLLPLGWSPVSAFDLQSNNSTSAGLSANFTGLPILTLHLVSYSYSIHGWSVVKLDLTPSSNGALTVSLPSTGDFALVVADPGATIPAVGQPLPGLTMVALPATTTSSGSLSPGNVGPGGGTSMASLAVQSQATFPSGTVIQAKVTETYKLTSGQSLSEEPRYEDLLLYQIPAPAPGSIAGATFPVTPSQTFQAPQLTSGDVHLDILSGRESVRGEAGGSDPVSVQSGGATLTIAAGSLPQDTAINVTSESVDVFLPATSTLVPLAEYNLDFSGKTLTSAAQLSVGSQGLAPGTNVLIAQIERIAGVPYLVVVGTAQVTATNIVSQVTPGLPGIIQEGDYVFYELTIPTGFVSGTVSASSGPVAAMVQTDALPFVTFANASGSYDIVAAAGTVNLTASVPNTALTGTITAQVVSGQTASANLTVVGQVETAAITPANGAVGVPLTAEIDLVAPNGFKTATVTSSNVLLTASGSTTPVPVRFVYSAGNTKLAVFPQNALLASTLYTFQASGIANALGGLISVPTISFTTAAITVPTYNTNALVFGMPDQNGNVSITAPAGSFPAGTTLQILDQTNGIVLTLTALNDGSVSGSIPASISDTLQVTLTDTSGNQSTYTISQFVAADGTTAIGPGGGTVIGPGNTGIIVPAGALPQGVTFQLTQLDQTAFPVLPTWTGANFGSGLRITDPAMPTFKKEAKLAFPVPANAPSNAFYYVFRRLTDQNGNTYFETIDEAFVQGTGASAQVVTASPPFCGYHNSYGNFSIQADSAPLPVTAIDQDYFVMWDATAGHGPSGIASTGLIVGLATQTVPAVLGQSQATTQPAQGTVSIFLTPPPGSTGTPPVAIYDGQCATFSLFDPQLGGGSRNITATQIISTPTGNVTNTLQATVSEVDGAQQDDGLYAIYAGLEDLYKNIGRVNLLFPAPTPPPPPPAVTVYLYTLNSFGHRVPSNGILQTGSQVVIAFQSNLKIQSASIDGNPLQLETPDSTEGVTTDGKPEQYLQSARVQGLYTIGPPGNYTISVTAQDPVSLVATLATDQILVVAAGNSNTGTLVCTAAPPPADPTTGCSLPQVINVYPASYAIGVDIGTFPEIAFNEPVTNIPGNVVLSGPNGPVQAILVGVRAPNSPGANSNPIANPVDPNDQITSLTIQPTAGLNFGTVYTITLNANAPSGCLDSQNNPMPQPTNSTFILDLNKPPTGPFCLPPFPGSGQQYSFTTFAPGLLGGSGAPYAVLTRPVVIGNTAYAGEYLSSAVSGLGMFDVSNPTAPKPYPPVASFIGRAIDIAGQAKSPVTASKGGLIALAAGTAVDNAIPGNVWLYDVSSPFQPTRVGAVSVSSDVTRGIPTRLFMKDNFLYANTFQKGLQVIDLNQALSEYATVYFANPIGFGQAVSTAGDGFAMDAVTNTIALPQLIGVPPQPTGSIVMNDLKAYDIATTGGGASTLIVATGQLPFVMADPTNTGGLSAVVYPPSPGGGFYLNPVQPLSMTSGTNNYLLCYGIALDVGSIPIPNSNGTTSNQQLAVVVGYGIIGASTTCPTTGQKPVFAVVSFNNLYYPGSSYTPQLTSMMYLPTGTTGTDVTLNGTTALVSTGGNILMINVANPAQPSLDGTITGNFGNWLSLTSSGFIIGSSSAGIQTASEKPLVSATCPTPILTSVYSGAGTASVVYQPIQPITGCTVTVSPKGTPAANVSVTFTGISSPITFNNISLDNNGVGQLPPIPQTTLINGPILYAAASATNPQTGLPITGVTTSIPVGPVHIVVDSDNDTVIDPVKDPQAAGSGKAFNFWINDPNGLTINGGQDALLDFAPLRVYVNSPAPPGGKIQLTLSSTTTGNIPVWGLTQNAGVPPGASDTFAANSEKLYLQDSASSVALSSTGGITATNQIKLTNLSPVTCSAATNTSFTSQLCLSSLGSIELPNLQQGMMYDLIFSIYDTCFNGADPTTCLSDTSWKLQVQLVMNGQTTVLDSVPIDIRPLQQRMTAYTIRGGSNGAIQPPAMATLVPATPIPWMDVPSGATKVNVVVHGYDVSLANATTSAPGAPGFFPTYFKRLYWTGMPMMMAQGNTQTVGIAWYGDVNKFNWPDDEFSALLAGVPLAKFFTDQANAGRSIRVVAHSLGNMVVNSAINRLIVDGPSTLGAIKSYVMNEAAVPSEAYDATTALGASSALISNAQSDDGYNDDQIWASQFQSFTSSQTQQWNGTLSPLLYTPVPLPQYGLRWTQKRPAGGVPDNAPANGTPARGSWLGFFANNPNYVTITNTVNDYDFVLGAVWFAAEYCEKPNIIASFTGGGSFGNCFPNTTIMTGVACASIFGGEEVDPEGLAECLYGLTPGQYDDADKQYWGALTNTGPQNEVAWGGNTICTQGNCPHANITRQFQELSYWFPSISYAEGAGGTSLAVFPVTNLSKPVTNSVTTFDFSTYSPQYNPGPSGDPTGAPTHSYMADQPYSIVSPAWIQIRNSWCPLFPTCN